ncbi:MAG: hypothetical protein ACYTEG_12955 [Planctomycetota bacterium]
MGVVATLRVSMCKAGNIALLCLVAACSQASDTRLITQPISQAHAEQVRDDCVGESLRLLQDLSDRLAPLARADNADELAAVAFELGCDIVGEELYCHPLGLILRLERNAEITAMFIEDMDAARGVVGEMRIHNDAARGHVLAGFLHRFAEDGCEAVLEFEELVALEAYGLPGGSLGLYFSEGAVDLTVFRPDATQLAHGSAALTGRHALIALNFESVRLLDEVALD